MVSRLQTVTGNNGAAATTSVAATLAASTFGTTLIAAVMCGGLVSIIPPSGWNNLGLVGTNPSAGTLGLFRFENNPGGITTVTFTIGSSLAACVISEYNGLPTVLTGTNLDVINTLASANGATATIPSLAVQGLGELIIAAIGYINTAALVLSAFPAGLSQDGSAIGTAGAANANVHLLSNVLSGVAPITGSVTLSGTPTNGPSCIDSSFKQFVLLPNNGFSGPYSNLGQ